VTARPAAPANPKFKARLQTKGSDQAAQSASASVPADVQRAVADILPKAVEAAPSEPVPAAEATDAPTESPRKSGRVPSRRIAALQGSPGPADAPASHKRPADPGSGDAPLESAPSSPRGAVKSRAKRSKRHQLDDEVVKAKYITDLKQYVEERGMICHCCGLISMLRSSTDFCEDPRCPFWLAYVSRMSGPVRWH